MDKTDPKNMDKPMMRCEECDREVDHYNTFLLPTGESRVVCWECPSVTKRALTQNATSDAIPAAV